MATENGVAMVFAILQNAPCLPTEGFDAQKTFDQWVDATERAGVDDDQFVVAADIYVRRPGARWWPSIGQLLAIVFAAEATNDDGDIAWGEMLREYARRGRNNPPRMLTYQTPPPLPARDPITRKIRMVPVEETPPERVWHLDDDPARRAAKEAGLENIGGWVALDRLDERVAHRAGFRSTYVATRSGATAAQFARALSHRRLIASSATEDAGTVLATLRAGIEMRNAHAHGETCEPHSSVKKANVAPHGSPNDE